jgi:hypothetical protein
MDSVRRQAFDHLVLSGYVTEIQEFARSLSAPFWWHEDFEPVDIVRNSRPITHHNGTICLVDTGEKILGVTADHVYAAFLHDVQDDPTLQCQIGSARIDPQKHLVDRDSNLDLATFELSHLIVNASHARVHTPSVWPPEPPDQGSLAILGGWPAMCREEHPDRIDARFASVITRIDQVSAGRMGITLGLAESLASGPQVLPANAMLGGVSGGPVFLIREEPVVSLLIVGFIYEYERTCEILLARHASAIRPDGTLDR